MYFYDDPEAKNPVFVAAALQCIDQSIDVIPCCVCCIIVLTPSPLLSLSLFFGQRRPGSPESS